MSTEVKSQDLVQQSCSSCGSSSLASKAKLSPGLQAIVRLLDVHHNPLGGILGLERKVRHKASAEDLLLCIYRLHINGVGHVEREPHVLWRVKVMPPAPDWQHQTP